MSLKSLVMKFADETMKDVLENKLSSSESDRDKYQQAIAKLIADIEQDGILLPTGGKDLKMLTLKITDNTTTEETYWGAEDEHEPVSVEQIATQERMIPTVRTEERKEPVASLIETSEPIIPIQPAEDITVKVAEANERIIPIELAN